MQVTFWKAFIGAAAAGATFATLWLAAGNARGAVSEHTAAVQVQTATQAVHAAPTTPSEASAAAATQAKLTIHFWAFCKDCFGNGTGSIHVYVDGYQPNAEIWICLIKKHPWTGIGCFRYHTNSHGRIHKTYMWVTGKKRTLSPGEYSVNLQNDHMELKATNEVRVW